MVKSKVIIIMVLFLGIGGVAHGLTVVGSKHDMTKFVSDATTRQVCVFCHTPHGGSADAPLWNHTLSNATYTLYTPPVGSPPLQGAVSQPVGVSKACLSCHDGTVAVNSLMAVPRDGETGKPVFIPSSSPAYVGTDLNNMNPSHPVSITYRPDLDKNLRDNMGRTEVTNGSVTLPLYGGASPYLVECGSCHNVHDASFLPFLRVSSDQLCSVCHLQ
ncbi:MAG: cytochrome c3 family protein [Thermodesulfovibrionales bacterium]